MRILRVTASSTILNPDNTYQPGFPGLVGWLNTGLARDDDTGTQATVSYGTGANFISAFRLQPPAQDSRWVCFGAEVLHENTTPDANTLLGFYFQRTAGTTLYSLQKGLPGPGTTTTILTTIIGANYTPGASVPFLTIQVIKNASSSIGNIVGIKEVRFLYKPRGLVRYQEIG